jgi:tetratricopeptide (TPR) repeat protein
MAKSPKKQEKQQKNVKKYTDVTFSLPLNSTANLVILSVLLILSIVLPYYYISYAFSINHFNSFPLDDPWIHLNFAKNLAEYGSFSYFRDEIVTAGSTSPIYTFLLAAGFFITKNEMWLSYMICILFFTLSVFYFYKLSNNVFPKENWLAISAVLLLVMDKWLNLITATGMETTLYIFLLVACFYYYRKRNAIGFPVTLGLAFWTRPDAIAFIAAIAADYFLQYYLKQRAPKENTDIVLFTKNELIKIGVIFGIIMGAYFLMNLAIAGSLLPNTYGAKLAYYSPELRSRAAFLKDEVWVYLTESAYMLIFIPFVFGIIKLLTDSFKLKYNNLIPAFLFIVLLIFIYWYKLPYAHRFGRYMMPIFPFYILLAVYGGRIFFSWLAGYLGDTKIVNAMNIMLIASTLIYFGAEYNKNKVIYQEQSKHIYIRQVEAARWLANNTPEGTVIATHDVGAIAYYSNRKVIDVVGLINPEFITKLNTKEFVGFVEEQLKKQNVTYIAFLKEWFQVVNQKPLFTGGDNNYEIMEIYKYDPLKTHILSTEVNSGLQYAGGLLNQKQFKQASNVLNQLVVMDPNSSLTYFMLAYASLSSNDPVTAERSLEKAIAIYPGYRDAVLSLSNIYKAQNKLPQSKELLQSYLKSDPSDSIAVNYYNSIKDLQPKQDTAK